MSATAVKPMSLCSQEREERNFFVVPHQQSPAHSAKDESDVDEGGGEGDLAPIGERDLRGEEMKVEVNSRACPQKQGGKHQQQNQTQNPSALLHAFSVQAVFDHGLLVCSHAHVSGTAREFGAVSTRSQRQAAF